MSWSLWCPVCCFLSVINWRYTSFPLFGQNVNLVARCTFKMRQHAENKVTRLAYRATKTFLVWCTHSNTCCDSAFCHSALLMKESEPSIFHYWLGLQSYMQFNCTREHANTPLEGSYKSHKRPLPISFFTIEHCRSCYSLSPSQGPVGCNTMLFVNKWQFSAIRTENASFFVRKPTTDVNLRNMHVRPD